MTTGHKLPPPLGICERCYADQTFHTADMGQDVYYCEHTETMAVPKADWSGWLSESGIDRAEFTRRCDSAAADLQMFMAGVRKPH